MNDLKTEFNTWYFNEFTQSKLFRAMLCVTEGSPHHREGSVGIHTNMVVGQYLTMPFDIIGAFACAFHDVGKPRAMEAAHSEERGTYYRFRGHELISARLWENWAVQNWHILKERFLFNPKDIYRVSWLIENHLPWGIKKAAKRKAIAQTVGHIYGNAQTFTNVLMADTWGRISDDFIEKRETVLSWCVDFEELVRSEAYLNESQSIDPNAPILYVLIGASGSGKSTYVESLDGDIGHYSWDSLRTLWYDKNDYENAFRLACEDNEFMNKANTIFSMLVKTGESFVVDNINTSKKRRAHFIRQARDNGYRCVGVVFPVQLETIQARQGIRDDKSVPPVVVERQYMSVQMPSIGEFDEVIVHDGNLEKY